MGPNVMWWILQAGTPRLHGWHRLYRRHLRRGERPDCSTPVDAQCDDGFFCNGAETCDAAVGCKPGTAPTLTDNVDCTTDTCDETTDQIVHTPVNTQCDDGEFCNGSETCDAVLGCQAGTAPTLTDNIDCTTDTCDEVADQIVHTPVNAQ